MPRSDSTLITGVTSASLNKAARTKAARDKVRKEKEEKQTKLAPAAELIAQEFNKEIEATQKHLLSRIDIDTSEQAVKDVIVALNMYTDSMKNLKHRLANIMRVKK